MGALLAVAALWGAWPALRRREPSGSAEHARAARSPARAVASSSRVESPRHGASPEDEEPALAAEDVRLGTPWGGEDPVQVTQPPPEPPRASVDLEPQRADDPRDFELR